MANKLELILKAYDQSKQAFNDIKGSFQSLRDQALSVQGIFRGLIYSAPFLALAGAFKKAVDTGEELLKTSHMIGISVEQLSGLKYAAELSETSMESLTTGVGILSKALAGVSEETPDAAKTLKLLGIDTKDALTGGLRPTYDILLDIADRFSKMEDGAGKTAIAMKIFGRGGKELIVVLNEGKVGLKEMHEEAVRLGIVMSGDAARAADQFNDNFKKLKANMSGLAISITSELLPALNQLFDMFSKTENPTKLYLRLAELDREIGSMQSIRKWGKEHGLGAFIEEDNVILDARIKEREKILEKLWDLQLPKDTAKKPAPFAPQASEEMEKLLEKWRAVQAQLKIDISKTGLDEFKQLIIDIDGKTAELLETFKKIPAAAALIKQWSESAKVQTVGKREKADWEKDLGEEEKGIDARIAAHEWLTEQINKATLSEFDYERTTLLKEYEERAKVIGWTEELYETFKGNLKKLDDREVENKKETLRQIRDLELQNQLAIIDIKEKTFQLSEGEAVQQKLEAENEYLQKLNEEYLATVGIDEKRKDGLELLAKIRDIQKEIVDLQLRQEELTGSLADGWNRGIQEFAKEMPTAFQEGVDLAKTSFKGLQDTLSNMSFDAIKGKFKGWADYVTSLCDLITKKMLDMMAQWLLFGEGGKGQLGGLFGLLGIGRQPQFETTPGGKIPQYDLTQETEAGSGIFATVFKDAGKDEEARQGGFLDGIKGIFEGILGGFGGIFKDLIGSLSSIIGSIASGIGNLISSIFHQGGLVMHEGGLIPQSAFGTPKFYVPRFHFGGLNDDERMTINKVGERYITAEQNSWLTNIGNTMRNITEPQRIDNRYVNIDMGGINIDAGIAANKQFISDLRNNLEKTIIDTVRKHM